MREEEVELSIPVMVMLKHWIVDLWSVVMNPLKTYIKVIFFCEYHMADYLIFSEVGSTSENFKSILPNEFSKICIIIT